MYLVCTKQILKLLEKKTYLKKLERHWYYLGKDKSKDAYFFVKLATWVFYTEVSE